MLQVDLTAQIRQNFGKGAARTLRRAGQTPAVIYGQGVDTQSLELDTKSFTKTLLGLKRRHAVVNIDIKDGKKKNTRHVMIKDLQVHPLKDTLVHADFFEVSLEKPMKLDVPVIYTGKAIGVDLGGEQIASMTTVSLEGKVLDIPDFIEIDVSGLNIGDSLTCGDLAIPENVSILDKADAVCVLVQVMTEKYEEEEEEEVEVAEAAEGSETAESSEGSSES